MHLCGPHLNNIGQTKKKLTAKQLRAQAAQKLCYSMHSSFHPIVLVDMGWYALLI